MERSEGFSLVELLVVVSVLTIVALLAFGFEREALARLQVEAATRRVLLGLERGRALAEREGRACALSLDPQGWRLPSGGLLPGCPGGQLELTEGFSPVGAVRVEHNLPAAVRFSSNGLVLDGGTVLVGHPATALLRCVVVSLPLGVARVGLQAEAGCRPDPDL
jgi:prepilin-type N-terminal cleavage/methylation domain-containing protein